jgi:hypothetical protein
MTQEMQTEATATDLAELKKLFGPPPVLSTESTDTYYAIMDAFIKCFKPGDFMVAMFMKDLTDSTWDAMRYARHKTLAMERKYRQGLEIKAARAKEVAERKRLAAAVKKDDEDNTPAEKRSMELLIAFESAADDALKILEQPPTELDHARALQDVMEYYERLDQLLSKAIARRNDALEQIGLYREFLGHQLRRVSDEIIDAEFSEAKPEEAPLVPTSVPDQCPP